MSFLPNTQAQEISNPIVSSKVSKEQAQEMNARLVETSKAIIEDQKKEKEKKSANVSKKNMSFSESIELKQTSEQIEASEAQEVVTKAKHVFLNTMYVRCFNNGSGSSLYFIATGMNPSQYITRVIEFYQSKVTVNASEQYEIKLDDREDNRFFLSIADNEASRQRLARDTEELFDRAYVIRFERKAVFEDFNKEIEDLNGVNNAFIQSFAKIGVIFNPTILKVEFAKIVHTALTEDNLVIHPLIKIILMYYGNSFSSFLPEPIKTTNETAQQVTTPLQRLSLLSASMPNVTRSSEDKDHKHDVARNPERTKSSPAALSMDDVAGSSIDHPVPAEQHQAQEEQQGAGYHLLQEEGASSQSCWKRLFCC